MRVCGSTLVCERAFPNLITSGLSTQTMIATQLSGNRREKSFWLPINCNYSCLQMQLNAIDSV